MITSAFASSSLAAGLRSALAFATTLVIATGANAQCDGWASGFGLPGVDGVVSALASHDDGQGSALYLGGSFRIAGDVTASRIVRWDGERWSQVGDGLDFAPTALVVHDDGAGPALYAGGSASLTAGKVARWNGTLWSELGSGFDGPVRALHAYDEGTGVALYAGGFFANAGGASASNVARWDGTSWSPLGAGANSAVGALTSFDDGNGLALYAGGSFTSAGGIIANHVARWDGTSWAPVATGLSSVVHTFASFDDGNGAKLYAGGQYNTAAGSSGTLDRWDGTSWSAVAHFSGLSSRVLSLVVHDDGAGPELHAGGRFGFVSDPVGANSVPAQHVARWDGVVWSPLAGGVDSSVRALAVHDDGSGAALYAGGDFRFAGERAASRVARWQASTWSALDARNDGFQSIEISAPPALSALFPFDDGSGDTLYAAGEFDSAGDEPAHEAVRWDGASWTELPFSFAASIAALAAFDDGSGNALYAGGSFFIQGAPSTFGLARWSGSNWSPVGGPMTGAVSSIQAGSDAVGGGLYVGGTFTIPGVPGARRIARWNGTSWSQLAGGVEGTGSLFDVRAITEWNVGAATVLVAAGRFDIAGGVLARNVAQWNGTSWSALGAGLDQRVHALAVFDDGRGPALYAGGEFLNAGGVPAARIARWNGASWSAVAGGFDGTVNTLYVHDDGHGRALYAAGEFLSAGGMPARRIARFDGSTWSALGEGIAPGAVHALAAFDDGQGAGRRLCVGGQFSLAGSEPSSSFAIWAGCASSSPLTFCTSEELGEACPCANAGSAGHGCANSSHASGARLSIARAVSDDVLEIEVDGLPRTTIAVLVTSASTRTPLPFGRGLVCTGDALQRTVVPTTAGGFALRERFDRRRAHDASTADTHYYQVLYRDSGPASCPSSRAGAWNATNAVVLPR